MKEGRTSAQCRFVMPPSPIAMLPDADTLARRLADILGGLPNRALAERLLTLCHTQLAAARPALEFAVPMDTPDDHAAVLRELARHG